VYLFSINFVRNSRILKNIRKLYGRYGFIESAPCRQTAAAGWCKIVSGSGGPRGRIGRCMLTTFAMQSSRQQLEGRGNKIYKLANAVILRLRWVPRRTLHSRFVVYFQHAGWTHLRNLKSMEHTRNIVSDYYYNWCKQGPILQLRNLHLQRQRCRYVVG
jgi:hypothetical protein